MDEKESKPKPKIVPISFKLANLDCLEHLDKQSNRSEYICQLIRLDMACDILRKSNPIIKAEEEQIPKVTYNLDVDEDTFDF